MRRRLVASAVICILVMPSSSYGYIDPNAGGWIYQALLPVLAAVGGIWAVGREKIARLIDLLKRRKK